MQNSVKKSDPKGSLSTSAASTSRTVPKVGTAPQLAQSASCGADTNATNSARWLMDSVDAWFKVQNWLLKRDILPNILKNINWI